jgi:5'(3')-deoxyribonucleotidase
MTSTERLRIGLDFDGTLADTVGAGATYLREVEGITLQPHELIWPPGLQYLGRERFMQMLADDRFMEVLEFVPGALEVTRSLMEFADVFVVTARYEEETAPARRWLDGHGLRFVDIVSTDNGSKVDACRALRLDIHFDDTLTHTADVMAETDTILALLSAPWNDLSPAIGDHSENRPHVHATWHDFHDWTRDTFEERLSPR